jgi:CRP-like cAMP-binding protein
MLLGQRPTLAPANLLLAQLTNADRNMIEIACARVSLRPGDRLGGLAPVACFPTGAVISLVNADGVEIALVGREGMSAWSILLSGTPDMHAIAACSGEALVLPTTHLTELCRRSSAIRSLVLRSVEALTGQMMATIGASARHSVRARLTRRLLMLHDRSASDRFEVKHSQIARALSVRRASVTDALHLLEGEHVLQCRRNHIGILDRPALERVAGAAYAHADRITLFPA